MQSIHLSEEDLDDQVPNVYGQPPRNQDQPAQEEDNEPIPSSDKKMVRADDAHLEDVHVELEAVVRNNAGEKDED
jgi:hypothetical protein